MRQEIINQLKKEKFWEKILNMKTPAEIKKAFKEENIDISNEEIQEVGEDVYSFLKKLSKMPDSKTLNELSDKEIENISGGVVVTATAVFVALFTALGAGAKSTSNYFKAQTAAERTKQARIKTQGKLAQQTASYTLQGIIHDNPGYSAMVGIAGIAGAAYTAKLLIGAIKDGNLLKWFETDDDDDDYE